MGLLDDGWNIVSGGVKGAAEGIANGDPAGAAASMATGGVYTPGGDTQQGSGGSENSADPAAADGSGGEGHGTVMDARPARDIVPTVEHAQHHIGPGNDDQGPDNGWLGHSDLTPGPNYGYGLNGAYEHGYVGAEDQPTQYTVSGDGLTTQGVVNLAKTVDPSQHHDTVLSGPPINTDTIIAGPHEKGLTDNNIQPAERTVDEALGPVGSVNTEDVVRLAKSVDPSQHADAVMAGPAPVSGIEAALNPQPLPPHGEEVALNPQPLPPHGEDPIGGVVDGAGAIAHAAVSVPASIFAAPHANPAAAELNPQPLPPHGGGPQDVVGTVVHDATRSLSGLLNTATHLPSAVAGHTGLTHDGSGPVALNPQPLPPHGDPTIRTHSQSADADTSATTRTQPHTSASEHESHLAERVASSLSAGGSAHGPEAHYPAGLSHSDPAAHGQLGVHEQLHAADHPHGLGLADHHGHDGL